MFFIGNKVIVFSPIKRLHYQIFFLQIELKRHEKRLFRHIFLENTEGVAFSMQRKIFVKLNDFNFILEI